MTHIIVGLGNPEPEYKGTRHNVGRFVVQEFIHENMMSEPLLNKDLGALLSNGEINSSPVVAVFPDTYMNNSGEPVKKAMKRYDVKLKNIIVVHDDIDLPFGTLRISKDRGSGGHNGLGSIVEHVGSKDFMRVRIGVSPVSPDGKMHKPDGDKSVQHFVLSRLPKSSEECLNVIASKSISAIELMLSGQDVKAMDNYNGAHCLLPEDLKS